MRCVKAVIKIDEHTLKGVGIDIMKEYGGGGGRGEPLNSVTFFLGEFQTANIGMKDVLKVKYLTIIE